MSTALIILGMALGTYLTRGLPVLILGSRLPAGLQRRLDHVAPAVLGAVVAQAAFTRQGVLVWERSQLAYGVALVVAVATRRVWPTLGAGLAALWLLGGMA